MKEYHKIQTVYFRDPENNHKTLLEGTWAKPEFELLKDIDWICTEKIDGCLHYTSQIYTDKGLLMVGRIVENKLPVKVLSYNIQKGIVEYKDIKHYHKEKRQRDFLCVSIKSRNKGNRPKYIVCTDNHKFFSNNKWIEAKDLKKGQLVSHLSVKLPEEIQQVILGTLLGDGSIYRPSKTTRGFSFTHSISQSDYFDYKKMLLGDLFKECNGYRGGFTKSKENRRGNSIVNNSISELIINYCEQNNKKQITENWCNELSPIGIAFWYMDDGTVNFNDTQRPRVRFATNSFNDDDVKLLQKMFKIKYNIDSKIADYKGNTLCLSANGSEKLFSIIFPYICDSMKYKLPAKYKKCPCSLNNKLDTCLDIADTEVLSVSKKLPKKAIGQQTFQYDLSIKDNSNYFTNSILVHNTNIRVMWDGENVRFSGKTDNAQIPSILIEALQGTFTNEKMKDAFPDADNVCLYGEGYGKKIQKGGNYLPDRADFILFDVKVGEWWLTREANEDIAQKLNIGVVPIIGIWKLEQAIDYVKNGFKSTIADNKEYIAEGLIMKPKTELFNRRGERVITKIKHKDFSK